MCFVGTAVNVAQSGDATTRAICVARAITNSSPTPARAYALCQVVVVGHRREDVQVRSFGGEQARVAASSCVHTSPTIVTQHHSPNKPVLSSGLAAVTSTGERSMYASPAQPESQPLSMHTHPRSLTWRDAAVRQRDAEFVHVVLVELVENNVGDDILL